MPKRARADSGFPPSVVGNNTAGTFVPSSVDCSGGSKTPRHAVGNWPSFVQIQLPGLRIPCAALPYDDDDDEDSASGVDDEAQLLVDNARKAFRNCRQLLDPSTITKTYFDSKSTLDGQSSPDGGSVAGSPTSKARHNWGHISLAKPFALRKHEIEPFVAMLRAEVKRVPAFSVSVASSWCLLPSDQNTSNGDCNSSTQKAGSGNSDDAYSSLSGPSSARCFAALDIAKGLSGSHTAQNLARLVGAVDRTLERFGRPPYFNPPQWHVTFAEIAAAYDSTAVRPLREQQRVPKLGAGNSTSSQRGGECQTESDEEADFDVKEIEVKAGHLRFALPLMAS